MRSAARELALQLMDLLCRFRRRQVGYVVLTYHQLVRSEDVLAFMPNEWLDASVFEQQISYLAKQYKVIGLDEMVSRILRGRQPEDLYVSITFDDGYKSNYDIAYPILHSHSLPATFFVTTDFIEQVSIPWWDELLLRINKAFNTVRSANGGLAGTTYDLSSPAGKKALYSTIQKLMKAAISNKTVIDQLASQIPETFVERLYMDWDELRWLHRQPGVTIGSHGVSHRRNHEIADQLLGELLPSKCLIERELGANILFFSYPFGTPREIATYPIGKLEEAGFLGAFTSIEGFNIPGAHPFLLKRIPAISGEQLTRFATRLKMADLISFFKSKCNASLH